MRKGSLFAVFAALATFFMVAHVASAQYPVPKTNIVCAVNQIDVKVGGSTVVAATLRDTSGSPLAGYTVNFKVISGSATLSNASATTDSSGTAVVTVTIESAGTVVVRASSESSECQASSEVKGIVPPNTGDGGLLGGNGYAAAVVPGLAFAAVLAVGSLVAARRAIRA